MYQILYEGRVRKDLDKIPDTDVRRILEAVKKLSSNPLPFGVKKLSGKPGLYRVREGDYRIVYTVNHKSKEVGITLIGHRKESYRHL